ncbi:MAG: 6-phosphofructokinase [Clostridia bacterium]|nr:6-phosphofructokinase [Clostridia bacterium]MBR6564191.1 6-phosphofructokinase [Clostridia bacterium]MBR6741801.1 6-phosphofructokinase [Clostridia bacterium]
MKTIGVLTSGGDAPGMNAAVRAVVRTAVYNGITVKGIRRGYNGLMEGDIIDLDSRAVSGIIQLGGTMLYSARSPRFKTEEGVKEAAENCKKHGIEGIVVIGGDGSFRGARDLSLAGIPCVGIPATIDNDISSTEYTIGFDTAMNTVIEMVDRLRDTCDSHERCSVVEVMGRHAGHIALRTAIGVGALAVMVPERENDLDAVIEKIKETQRMGKKHFIVMVAEGVGGVTEMAKKIEAETGIETRGTILGHVQRGGSPTLRDRLIATQMGFAAVELLKEGIGNRVVAYKLGKVVDYDIYEALNMKKGLEDNLCLLAEITAI